MRAHGSRSQQEPAANRDQNIDNVINANIGRSGARRGNNLSHRSRLRGENEAFLHPLLFRLDCDLWNLHGLLSISYAGHYHSCKCIINGLLQWERGNQVDFWMLSFGCLSEAPNR